MQKELKILLNTIEAAGDAVEAFRKNEIAFSLKQNQSPVTEADLIANNVLKKNLLTHFPQDGWLSEETIDEPSRLQSKRIWIVDPIDGTKEFIKRIPEYAISVALIEKNQPILAAIYNPATQALFYAIKNQGAWHQNKKMQCTQLQANKLSVLASRTEISAGKWDKFKEIFIVKEMGSIAYKLALVANGFADGIISLDPKSEWDIAAGLLLIQEAGGNISDLNGNALCFNQSNILINGIIAGGKDNYRILCKYLPSVHEKN
ncbi:MAG: 3'(2'),5'-bisphosphate nucleotidase CysQ [Gammaproteobacteria bacterium]|nr:3'(2'),5'-bisphosphate nucleotidase CysQ [Gammaproteobacteria bacterium]